MEKKKLQELSIQATKARMLAVQMVHDAASGHPGGSLSCMDILTTLYFDEMRVDPNQPQDPDPNSQDSWQEGPKEQAPQNNWQDSPQNPGAQPGPGGQQPPYGSGQPPYGQNPYGNGQPPYGQPPRQTNNLALASMIVGIFALLACCIPFVQFPLAVVSIVLVVLSKKGQPLNGFAIAGLVLAIISIIISILMTLYWGFLISMMNDPEFLSIYNEMLEMYEY